MTTACRVPRFAISYAESRNSALAVSSQYVMPISRYLVEMLHSLVRCATIGAVTDADYMDVALGEAHEAFARGDWPVGSVLVCDGAILATGQNRQNTERDVTWHAEFEAMRRVMLERGAEALVGATVYSTMEPCPMCAAAMKLVRIARLVLGTRHATLQRTDLGAYSVETFCALTGYDLSLTTGVREAECTALRRRWGRDATRPTA